MSDHEIARAEVEAVNRAFYRAFEEGDIERMEEIWAHGPHVRCVHPGWNLLEGWAAVRQSWVLLFERSSDMKLELERVVVRAGPRVAWVTCVERIVTDSSIGAMADEVLATNIFERADDESSWRMVQHHASPILRDIPEAMNVEPGPDELN
jgi:ketosteroid isomerase-like protein